MLADRLQPRAEKFAKSLIFLPMAISMVGAATIWRFVYEAGRRARRRSACSTPSRDVRGRPRRVAAAEPASTLNSLLLMVILIWAQVGFSMVLLSAAVKGVPDDTIEAARIDGAGERRSSSGSSSRRSGRR